MRLRCAVLSVLAILVVLPRSAGATATSPLLALSAASGAAADGARSAVVEGSFDFPNAVQVGYPLQLVVFQGRRFVRYPVAGTPVTGDSPELADGQLAATELGALMGEGTPAQPGVRIVTLAPDRVRVTLPTPFAAGPVTAVLFAILADGTVLSNPIDFALP